MVLNLPDGSLTGNSRMPMPFVTLIWVIYVGYNIQMYIYIIKHSIVNYYTVKHQYEDHPWDVSKWPQYPDDVI